MMVICIKNSYLDWGGGICKHDITIGKEYDAYIAAYESNSYYVVINDDGIKNAYPLTYFITLEEYRNKKLGEIGI